jgi:hypothetical protein
MALGSKQPLTVRKADNLTTILCRCHVIWSLNFPEPSGPFQACITFLPMKLLVVFLICQSTLKQVAFKIFTTDPEFKA